MNKYLNLLLVILLLFSSCSVIALPNSKASYKCELQGNFLQGYYKSPALDRLVVVSEDMLNESKDYELYDLLTAFYSALLKQNSEYSMIIVKKFSSFSPTLKKVTYVALLASNHQNSADLILKKYNYKPSPNLIKTSHMFNPIKIESHHSIDLLWASYFSTGDKQYIRKILEYINQDEAMLILGFETLNRLMMGNALEAAELNDKENPLNDLKIEVQKKYPHTYKKKLHQASIVASAIWSINANTRQDPEISKKVEKIIATHSKLDFGKKINKAIGA